MRGERMLQQSTGLQLRSTVKKEGILELSLTSVPIPEPKPDEVVVVSLGSVYPRLIQMFVMSPALPKLAGLSI